MSRRYVPVPAGQRAVGGMAACARWTCLDCHHADNHLKHCEPTRKETRRRG